MPGVRWCVRGREGRAPGAKWWVRSGCRAGRGASAASTPPTAGPARPRSRATSGLVGPSQGRGHGHGHGHGCCTQARHPRQRPRFNAPPPPPPRCSHHCPPAGQATVQQHQCRRHRAAAAGHPAPADLLCGPAPRAQTCVTKGSNRAEGCSVRGGCGRDRRRRHAAGGMLELLAWLALTHQLSNTASLTSCAHGVRKKRPSAWQEGATSARRRARDAAGDALQRAMVVHLLCGAASGLKTQTCGPNTLPAIAKRRAALCAPPQ